MNATKTIARRTAIVGVWAAVGLAVLLIAATSIYPTARGWVPLTIQTGSMVGGVAGGERDIQPGDLIFVDPVEDFVAEVRVGDVVSYMPTAGDDANIFTHRVVDIVYGSAGPVVTTKGDANNAPDAPVPAAAVRAKLVELQLGQWSTPFVIPKIGGAYLQLTKIKTESGIQEHIPTLGWILIGAGTLHFTLGGLLTRLRRGKRPGEHDGEVAAAPAGP